MNPSEQSDEALRAAFAARLDAAPEPSTAMLARTLAAIAAQTRSPKPGRRWATGWWSALAAPARFSSAAAIVIIGGTVVVGSMKATHERSGAADLSAASRVTFERHSASPARLAYHGSLQLMVRDIPASTRRADALVRDERGTIIARTTLRARPNELPATRLVLQVSGDRLRTTLDAFAALGTVLSRTVGADDMAGALTATSCDLRAARALARSLAGTRPPGSGARRRAIEATIARLSARQAELEIRTRTATLAVVLRQRAEPSPLARRPTSDSPARGTRLGAPGSDLAAHRIRSLDCAPSGDRAVVAIAGGTTTPGDDRTDRLRNAVADTQADTTSNPDAPSDTNA